MAKQQRLFGERFEWVGIGGDLEIALVQDFGLSDAEELLALNTGNRPKKASAVEKYAEDMLRRKWDLNGETIIVDSANNLRNGQNRLYGLLKAEKRRQSDPKLYAEKFGLRGTIKIPVLIVRGVKPATFRSMDAGEKRTGSDMFFVADLFAGYKNKDKSQEFKDADKKKLSRILATAARTAWLRLGGKDVADAPKLPPSALEEFVKKHPQLVDVVVNIFRYDNGGAGREKNISSLVSPAYMAAVVYLAGMSKTDRVDYDERGLEALNDSLMEEALSFADYFAAGAGLEEGSPILVLRKAYSAQIKNKEFARNRDVTLNMLVKAMVAFLNGETVKQTDLRWNPEKEPVPRLGGLDMEIEDEAEGEEIEGDSEPIVEEVVEAPKTKRRKSRKAQETAEEVEPTATEA